MLPRSLRVSRQLFDKTMKEGKLLHSSYFTLKIGSIGQEPSRFSFAVPKKVLARATKRNSLRRKGYQAVSSLLPDIKPGASFLFFAKKGAETLSVAGLQGEITSLLSRTSMLVSS